MILDLARVIEDEEGVIGEGTHLDPFEVLFQEEEESSISLGWG